MSEDWSRSTAKLINAGRRICDTFNECARIRVIYRQGDRCPFEESTRRMRDPEMAIADYELWKSRDIAPANCSDELKVRADAPLWIFEENASSGDR